MDVRELRYFLAVVREQNISKAAEVLHLTQPTLSRQMSQLEADLGAQLFVRGKILTLTDAGILLRRRAEEIVSLMDKVEGEFAEPNDVSGRISIGTGGQAASVILARAILSFRRRYPKVEFDIYTNNAEHIKERMDRGVLDFGLLLEPIEIEKYEYIRFREKEQWGVFMEKNHPLAKKQGICKGDLKDIQLITSGRNSIKKELEEWLGNDLSNLNILATYNIITNVASLISDADVCALTIKGAVNSFDPSIYVFRPLVPSLEMSSVFAWKKFQPGFSTAGKFLEHLKKYVENV